MTGGRCRSDTKKESTRNWIPGISQLIRIGEVARESIPIRQVKLGFGAVNDCLAECHWKTNRRILEWVVIGIVVHQATKIIGIEFDPVEKSFSSAGFVEISFRRPHGQLDGATVKACSCRGTRQQNVFKRWGLEYSIVRNVQGGAGGGKVARERQPRAYRLPIENELVVVPSKSSAHGPIAETNQILDKSGLFEVRAGS